MEFQVKVIVFSKLYSYLSVRMAFGSSNEDDCGSQMEIIRLLLITSLASIIPGQVIRIPIGPFGAFSLSDISVLAVDLAFLIYVLFLKKSFKLPNNTFFAASLFSLAALASTVLAANFFTIAQLGISLLFLIRFILYFFLAVVVYNVVKKKEIVNWLNILLVVGAVFTLLGFLQLIVFADLTFLTVYGWDPHQNRIVSSLIDPNFTGGLLTILLALAVSLFLYKKKNIYLAVSALFFVAVIFTFSRSSYLAFITAVFTIGVIKSPRVIFVSFLIFAIFLFGSSRLQQRIIGALTIDKTAKSRIESWQAAYSIFYKNFFFGVGFNTYRFAQAEYGYFSYSDPEGGHSGGGADSSLLLVAATTGIFGLGFYFLFLFFVLKKFAKKMKSSYLHLGALSGLLALIVHSQFVNSLFFPQIMLLIWFILGLVHVQDN